jgi:hypothetical protein
MTVHDLLRRAASEASSALPACFDCAHFRNDAAFIAAELPGLTVLSSQHASVLSDDGICDLHQSIINGRKRCKDHSRVGEAA